MILFFPQWQGAGPDKRIDKPARALLAHLSAQLPADDTAEIALDSGEMLTREQGIWGRAPILAQLSAARGLLDTRAPQKVFTIGGDCGIETAIVPYLRARYADFALVWLDAHPDLNTPESSPSATYHGMPLRVLMGEGDADFTALAAPPLTSSEVVLVGARSIDTGEQDFITRQRLINLPVSTPAAALVTLLHERGIRHIYIHHDFDVIDSAAWPHMNYPEPDGFTVAAVESMLDALAANFTVVGMSLTEYGTPDSAPLTGVSGILRRFVDYSRK